MNELLETKKRLYHLLLKKGSENWTMVELEIAFYLAKDKDIQDYLERMLNRK